MVILFPQCFSIMGFPETARVCVFPRCLVRKAVLDYPEGFVFWAARIGAREAALRLHFAKAAPMLCGNGCVLAVFIYSVLLFWACRMYRAATEAPDGVAPRRFAFLPPVLLVFHNSLYVNRRFAEYPSARFVLSCF